MFKKSIIILLTILFSSSFCSAGNPGEPHFGLCGYGPSQNQMLYKLWLDSGARITWWGPRWQELLGDDGKLHFDALGPGGKINLDKDVDSVISQGGVVVLHLHTGAGWFKVRDDTGDFPHKQSSPPKNMKEYYDFVYQTAQHFKGKVKYYEIENEPYLPGTWSGTNQEYFQLLKTAYQAAHAADPNVKITNGGIAMGCFVTYKINELLEQGKIQEAQEAYKRLGPDLYVGRQEMQGGPASQGQMPPRQRGQRPPLEAGAGDAQQFVHTKAARRIIDFMDYLFKDGYKYIDVLELHAYDDYARIEEVIDYTKSKMKQYGWQDRPLRMKVGWNYRVKLGEDKHAQDVVKNLAIVFGGGVDKALWFSIDDAEGNPHGLITKAPGNIPVTKPAYNTFKLTVEKLEGFSSVERMSLGPDTYGFKFIKANNPVYVLWSEANQKISLPLSVQAAKITSISSRETTINVEKGQLNLDLSASPIFVEEG